MKRYLWAASLIFGLFLLACSAVDPTREPQALLAGETAVATPSPPAATSSSLPPTMTVTQPATETATGTLLPTNPPTPQLTVTPTPRPTQIPSPTATLAAPEHLQPLAAGQTLPINYDLLFLNNGALQLWQPQTGQLETLLQSANANLTMDSWRLTPDKQTILLAQTHVDDTPGFTLFLFDTGTRQLHELWSEAATYLFAYDVATDGRSAAIITSTTKQGEDGGQETITVIDREQRQATTLTNCPNRRQKSYENREVDYKIRCHALVAVPNSDTWLWHDIEGVWQGGLHEAPRLLMPHDFFDDNDPPLIFSPTRDWSPNSRYQLLSARRFEGGTRWLLDMETGQSVILENSIFSSYEPSIIWQWTQDNRLLTLPPPNGADIFTELWHIEEMQLSQDAVLTLPNPNTDPIATLSQLPDGRLALIINGGGPNLGTITLVPGFAEPTYLLSTLPPLEKWWFAFDQSLTWTPDSAGAIYLLPGNEVQRSFYLPADGTALYELTELLGSSITRLVWLP